MLKIEKYGEVKTVIKDAICISVRKISYLKRKTSFKDIIYYFNDHGLEVGDSILFKHYIFSNKIISAFKIPIIGISRGEYLGYEENGKYFDPNGNEVSKENLLKGNRQYIES